MTAPTIPLHKQTTKKHANFIACFFFVGQINFGNWVGIRKHNAPEFEALERLEHFALSGEVQLPHDERSFAARAVIIDFAKRQHFVAVGGPKPQARHRRPPHFGADLVMVVFERKVAMPRRMMLEIGDFARDGDVAENRISLQHAFDVRVEVADRKGRFGSENWGEKVLHER